MRDTIYYNSCVTFHRTFWWTWSLCQMDKIRDCMTAFSNTCDAIWKWERRPLVNLIACLSLNMFHNRFSFYKIMLLCMRLDNYDIKWSVKQKREFAFWFVSQRLYSFLFFILSKLGCHDERLGSHSAPSWRVRTHSCVHASCFWSYQTSYDTTSFCSTLRRFNTRWAYERNARIIDCWIVTQLVTMSDRGKHSA